MMAKSKDNGNGKDNGKGKDNSKGKDRDPRCVQDDDERIKNVNYFLDTEACWLDCTKEEV